MRKRIKELLDLDTFPERQVQRDLQRLVWSVKWNTRKINRRVRLEQQKKSFVENEKIPGGRAVAEAERPLEPTG